ncbi:hypothetical protein MMC11_000439 [Xylographa trunciseda]|nr:hypothetical protein [Xylographa trunciseda]
MAEYKIGSKIDNHASSRKTRSQTLQEIRQRSQIDPFFALCSQDTASTAPAFEEDLEEEAAKEIENEETLILERYLDLHRVYRDREKGDANSFANVSRQYTGLKVPAGISDFNENCDGQ